VFLWLATRNLDPAVVESTLRQADVAWLIIGIIFYLLSIGLRCLRWGILLRATADVKWRHAAEALVAGYAANFALPGRIGEVFRADYAHRVFKMSRFTSFGTIVVERVCDGITLVCALWISIAWILYMQFALVVTYWIFAVGALSSALFGAIAFFIVFSPTSSIAQIRYWRLFC
jgi:glycosyltransferase 2 family protein